VILTDRSIRRHINQNHITIEPFPEDDAFQPASVELTLGDRFALPWETDRYAIERKWVAENLEHTKVWTAEAFAERTWTDICIGPDEFILGHTVETVKIPRDICAQVNGKSSLGRMGIQVHATAGFIDPGFVGQITLELKNMSKQPIWLKPGMRIAQLVFFMTVSAADRPYGHPELHSHYQGQTGAVRARGSDEYTQEHLPGL